MRNYRKIQKEQLDAYEKEFPNAGIPEGKKNCFALEDGECQALTSTWCKYEECRFYKPRTQRVKELMATQKALKDKRRAECN